MREVVVSPSGDTTGSSDTEALNAARASFGLGPGVVRLAPGSFHLRAGRVSTFGPGQSLIGAGKAQTLIAVLGSGAVIRAFDFSGWDGFSSATGGPRTAGRFHGFTIDGASAGADASGMHIGDFLGLDVRDVRIENFDGARSKGLWMDCVITWAERSSIEAELVNNTENVVFESHLSGQEYAHASYGYSHYAFTITASPGQNGVAIRGGCAFVGCDLTVRGNFLCGEANPGVALALGHPGELGSHLSACTLNWQVETNGRAAAHRALEIQNGSGIGNCQGIFNFLAGNGIPFADAAVHGNLSFTGTVLCPGLGSMAWPQAARSLGAVTGSVSRSLPVWASAGNYVWVTLQSGVVPFDWGEDASDLEGQAGTWELILEQPPSGDPGTVTWPAGWTWAGAQPPALSTLNNAVDRIRVVTPDFQRFFAEHVNASAARVSGTAKLSHGVAAVADARVTANTIVHHSRQAPGGALGELSVALAPGRGFSINSSSPTEASTVHWEIVSYPGH